MHASSQAQENMTTGLKEKEGGLEEASRMKLYLNSWDSKHVCVKQLSEQIYFCCYGEKAAGEVHALA